jgi:hypothetical protein
MPAAVEELKKLGLIPRLDGKGGFILRGLQGLDPDARLRMTEFARRNKPRIVAELERQVAGAGRATPPSAGQAADTSGHEGFRGGGFRGEQFFPSEFNDPLFRIAVAEGKFL